MFTKNIKVIKKISYYGLTLFSTVLTLAAPAAESFSKDFVEHPVKGGAVRVPQQPESPFDFLEKGIKMPWDYNTKKEDEAQRDLKSPPMGTYHQRSKQVLGSANLLSSELVAGIDDYISQAKTTLGGVENFFGDCISMVEKTIEEYQKKKEKERDIHLGISILTGSLTDADKKHLADKISSFF